MRSLSALFLLFGCAREPGGAVPGAWDGTNTTFAFTDAKIGVAGRVRADNQVMDYVTVMLASSDPVSCDDLNFDWNQAEDPRRRLGGIPRARPGVEEIALMTGWNQGQRWNALEGTEFQPEDDHLVPGEGAVPMITPALSATEFTNWQVAASAFALRIPGDCRGDLREAQTGFYSFEQLFSAPPTTDENNFSIRSFDELTPAVEVGELVRVGLLLEGDGLEVDGVLNAGWCGAWRVDERPVGEGNTCP